MGADHRKPAVAFVVLALLAVALVGSQRAEAQHGRLLAAVIAVGGQAESIRGFLPDPDADAEAEAEDRGAALGPMVPALRGGDEPGATRETTPSLDVTPALDAGADSDAPDRTSAGGATAPEREAGSGTGAEPGSRVHRRAAEVAGRAREGSLHGLATAAGARLKGTERRVAARAGQVPPVAGGARPGESHAQPGPPTDKAAPSQGRTQGHPWSRGPDTLQGLIGQGRGKVPGHAGRGPGGKHGHADQHPGRKYGHAGQHPGRKYGHAGQHPGRKYGHAGRGPGNRRGR